MFQDSNYYNINLPELAQEQQNKLSRLNRSSFIEELIQQQYIELKGLGIDYINGESIETGIYQNLIHYVNDNYIPIVQYETLLLSDKDCRLFGKMIYDFLILDLMKIIIPKTMGLVNSVTCLDLLGLSHTEWRYNLINAIKSIIGTHKQVRSVADNTKLKFNQFKFTYYIDLLDNDITGLLESFIYPMLNLYTIHIDSVE